MSFVDVDSQSGAEEVGFQDALQLSHFVVCFVVLILLLLFLSLLCCLSLRFFLLLFISHLVSFFSFSNFNICSATLSFHSFLTHCIAIQRHTGPACSSFLCVVQVPAACIPGLSSSFFSRSSGQLLIRCPLLPEHPFPPPQFLFRIG